MFLNIDAHNENKIALTDDTGETMSYGQLQNFILNFKNVMPTRSVYSFYAPILLVQLLLF